MRVLIGVLLLVVCAWQTHHRLEAWRSDQALFAAAVRVSPSHPRPALNLGHARGRIGDWAGACYWTRTARALAGERQDAWLLARVETQATWIAVFSGWCAD